MFYVTALRIVALALSESKGKYKIYISKIDDHYANYVGKVKGKFKGKRNIWMELQAMWKGKGRGVVAWKWCQ